MYFYEMNPDHLLSVRLINTARIQPPFVHNKRKTDEYIVYVIKKGKMYLAENNKKYTLVPGDFILLDLDYYHQGYKASECEYFYIHFRYENMIKRLHEENQTLTQLVLQSRNESLKSDPFSYCTLESDKVMIPKFYHFKNYSDFIKICCLLEEAAAHNRNHLDNYKWLCSIKVLEVFIETHRSYVSEILQSDSLGVPKSYSKVQELLEFLNTSFTEKITSTEIEKLTGCNFDYINRVFKKLTHKTIFSYLNTVRINHAKELISTTNMKVSEVGGAVGFSDLYYFSKVFKKAVGVPPSAYAKSVLK